MNNKQYYGSFFHLMPKPCQAINIDFKSHIYKQTLLKVKRVTMEPPPYNHPVNMATLSLPPLCSDLNKSLVSHVLV